MKTARRILYFFILIFTATLSYAETDSLQAKQHALQFADSLLQAYRYNNVTQYIEMSYPGLIKYYGGIRNFTEYIQRTRLINNTNAEGYHKTEIVQLAHEKKEWQCVIKKTSGSIIDGRHAYLVTYIIGQSQDGGQSWKYVDVDYNPARNLVYIMPDIFDNISVPQRQVIFEQDLVVKKQ
jgi:hypothetical protein